MYGPVPLERRRSGKKNKLFGEEKEKILFGEEKDCFFNLEKKKNEKANNLSWERNWAALLALSVVELLLIEESERRLVGRWPRLGGNSRLGLPQLGLHREELVLEGGTRGRGALGYGRAARARGNDNWRWGGWSRC